MKRVIAIGLCGLSAFFALAAPVALAARGQFPLPKAERLAQDDVRKACAKESGCGGFAWGCRVARGGALCRESLYFPQPDGTEVRCDNGLWFEYGRGGGTLRSYGDPHCYLI